MRAGRHESGDRHAPLRPHRRTRVRVERNSEPTCSRGLSADDAVRLESGEEQGRTLRLVWHLHWCPRGIFAARRVLHARAWAVVSGSLLLVLVDGRRRARHRGAECGVWSADRREGPAGGGPCWAHPAATGGSERSGPLGSPIAVAAVGDVGHHAVAGVPRARHGRERTSIRPADRRSRQPRRTGSTNESSSPTACRIYGWNRIFAGRSGGPSQQANSGSVPSGAVSDRIPRRAGGGGFGVPGGAFAVGWTPDPRERVVVRGSAAGDR
jgi:hypothetical protein